MQLKFTIVTVCFSAEKNIGETVQSVIQQTFYDYEYLIIDGGSTDKTLDIIKNFGNNEKIVVYSEKDRGIYNAMNKAITRANGEYIYFLNAGDTFYSKDTLLCVSQQIGENKAAIIYGSVYQLYNKKHFRQLRDFNKVKGTTIRKIRKGEMPCHQAMFVRRDIMASHYFNESYQIRADYEFFVYAIKNKLKTQYINLVIAYYPADGVSAWQTTKQRKQWQKETDRILAEYFPLWSICNKINIGKSK